MAAIIQSITFVIHITLPEAKGGSNLIICTTYIVETLCIAVLFYWLSCIPTSEKKCWTFKVSHALATLGTIPLTDYFVQQSADAFVGFYVGVLATIAFYMIFTIAFTLLLLGRWAYSVRQ